MKKNFGPTGIVRTTRRQMATGLFVACTAQVMSTAVWGQSTENKMATIPSKSANQSRTSLHQEIDYKASPERIYQVLLSSKDFTAFSRAAAGIDPKPGGSFSMFGGWSLVATLNWFRTNGSCRLGAYRRSFPREFIRW